MNYGAEEERERPLYLYGLEPFEEFFDKISDVWGDVLIG